MSLRAVSTPRFVRRTGLGPGEYRKNFRQIDCDVIAAVTSEEADRITPLMSKIYLRLASAPAEFWEREGVLYFSAGERDGRPVKASKVLYELLGVASATAHKALRWMHDEGVVGYFAGRNGAGIRIFINRAAGSIGVRALAGAGKKILPFAHGSNEMAHGSPDEPAFSDSSAVSEISETDLNPRAPKNGAETKPVGNKDSSPAPARTSVARVPRDDEEAGRPAAAPAPDTIPVEEIVVRLTGELEPRLREAAARAAAQSVSREMERTREWFETKALPKAVRVAQRETYDLLRKHGAVEGRGGRGSVGLEVGCGAGDYTAAARPLTDAEIRETAEICVAFLGAQGKSVDVTLSEISSEGGGWLLPGDAARVRELAEALAFGGDASRPPTGGGR